MKHDDGQTTLLPEYSEGRIFYSPILGCTGGCRYCYLGLRNYSGPILNVSATDDIIKSITENVDFIEGQKGTIISIGAWGDIFGLNPVFVKHSTKAIKEILKIGNPVQIMSKYAVSEDIVQSICDDVMYAEQLLYSTTITSIELAHKVEPGVPSPEERLQTCKLFSAHGVKTNVLIKPYIPGVTNVECEEIAALLLKYRVDYCVVGIMYWDQQILENMSDFVSNEYFQPLTVSDDRLDCAQEIELKSFAADELNDFIFELKKAGVKVFKKSSCVNSNILRRYNISGYYQDEKKHYCISCGNCQTYPPVKTLT